ncbi:hypothetical protein BAE44_0020770 [Dichanthelium oligosanthes]|uniref:PGG domain-containing protein n=1 Tax=Dichanthelium oligosanthes TaxID=888268 RepID=A0A1E5UZA9_9POAL|nr:hypothetical protein BAE44_0020770 [Dichanthelium oligosanthes]
MEPGKKDPSNDSPLEYHLQKYLLLLATLVAAVTYAAAFNPPGGVWQDTNQGYLAGEPIIRDTDYHRYLIFYSYCNATAFASSIVLIILILILAIMHEKQISYANQDGKNQLWILVRPLQLVMVFDLLEDNRRQGDNDMVVQERRKRLLLFAVLGTTLTYQVGLTLPSRFRVEVDEFGNGAGVRTLDGDAGGGSSLASQREGERTHAVTATPEVVEEEEDDEEDPQTLVRHPRQPSGKILSQGTSMAKRDVEEEAAIAPPPPKRSRSTAECRVSHRPSIVLSDSEETVSNQEILADVPAVGTGEEEDDAVVDLDPPTPEKPLPVVMPETAPETTTDVMEETPIIATAEGVAASASIT